MAREYKTDRGYVEKKIVHMLRMFGPDQAGFGPNGGAMPKHLADERGVKVQTHKRLNAIAFNRRSADEHIAA